MTTARAVCFVCFATLLVARCGAWATSVAVVPRQGIGAVTLEHRASLRGILRRIDDGEHEAMRLFFPEGGLFSLSFTGFTIASLARVEADATQTTEAREHVARLLALTDGERDVAPFSRWGKSAWRGVIYAGHRNLLRAAYASLGGTDAAILDAFHRESSDLEARFLAAPTGNLESFPGGIWPVDNVVALESLRLHDSLYGTHHGVAIERWARLMREHVDDSGLFVSQLSRTGESLDGPRGCALSWLHAFLPFLDEELAESQWALYRDAFGVDVLGMRGFREWPRRHDAPADGDSGPMLFGVGSAASAFGVAAARAHGDADLHARMMLPLEILTAPSVTLRGERELLGGHALLTDVLSLWSRTWTRLDAPVAPTSASPPLPQTAAAIALLLLPAAVAVRRAQRAWVTRTATSSPLERRVAAGHVAIVVAAFALDLSIPFAAIFWLALDGWSTRRARPA